MCELNLALVGTGLAGLAVINAKAVKFNYFRIIFRINL